MFTPPQLPPSADPAIFGPALKWWADTAARHGRLPRRADLLPEYLGAKALPYVILVDILEGGADFRFRLVGTAHTEFNRRELTGVSFGSFFPPGSAAFRYIKDFYRQMIPARRPLWCVNDASVPAREYPIRTIRLLLPMSQDGDVADLALVVQRYGNSNAAAEKEGASWHDAASIREVERILL